MKGMESKQMPTEAKTRTEDSRYFRMVMIPIMKALIAA